MRVSNIIRFGMNKFLVCVNVFQTLVQGELNFDVIPTIRFEVMAVFVLFVCVLTLFRLNHFVERTPSLLILHILLNVGR